ncbi:DUF4238 domain-containing protein [Clostridiaceae bacterium]|nr:DUF4238 domain-containing protein [Clostridiaceae bacterium]
MNLYILSNNLYRKNKLDKNMELKTIKQHYVPQFYLRNFEDKQHKLYVYNRQVPVFPETVSKINRLYQKGSQEQFQFLISHSNSVLRSVLQ